MYFPERLQLPFQSEQAAWGPLCWCAMLLSLRSATFHEAASAFICLHVDCTENVFLI